MKGNKGNTSRALSFSEVQTAMTCQARWDFAYGGRLAGSTLKRREVAPHLSAGRAWGAAVAAWHAAQDDWGGLFIQWDPAIAQMRAHAALRASYWQDVDKQREHGIYLPEEIVLEGLDTIGASLDHYMATAQRFQNLTRLEGEFNVPIPSRSGGGRASTRYRFHGFLDGYTIEDGDLEWLVEFKYRGKLTSVETIQRSRQARWYVWAEAAKQRGRIPVGIYIDERLNEAPKPARIVKAKRKADGIDGYTVSHAVDQMTTPESYIAACAHYGVDPNVETLDCIRRRSWQLRVPLLFRGDEIHESGLELVSAAETIRDLDNGRYPVRNAQTYICNQCDFRKICSNPRDTFLVDSLFERTEPKRLRPPLPRENVAPPVS
jgi:hypothetical protein